MSDEENFLSRWSQRKHDATKPNPEIAAEDLPNAQIATEMAASDETDEEFDLSTLPTIDQVTETTDITAFMRKGVPESLRNAALSKSWALDPAIRNYVNPALEYAYDWNTPGGVPGTSELAVGTDIVNMVSQIMGVGDSHIETEGEKALAAGPATDLPQAEPQIAAARIAEPQFGDPSVRVSSEKPIEVELSGKTDDADESDKNSFASQQEVRRHGTARPKV